MSRRRADVIENPAMIQESPVEAGAGASERIYALDGLRTTMLFFVVLFHCLLSYIVAPSRNWRFKDEMTTPVADLVVAFIHAFTLPTFFMLAGFFSAMLYLRSGAEMFARNRALRIALPFAVGWTILHPVVGAGYVFANGVQSGSLGDGLAAAGAALVDGSLLFRDSTDEKCTAAFVGLAHDGPLPDGLPCGEHSSRNCSVRRDRAPELPVAESAAALRRDGAIRAEQDTRIASSVEDGPDNRGSDEEVVGHKAEQQCDGEHHQDFQRWQPCEVREHARQPNGQGKVHEVDPEGGVHDIANSR